MNPLNYRPIMTDDMPCFRQTGLHDDEMTLPVDRFSGCRSEIKFASLLASGFRWIFFSCIDTDLGGTDGLLPFLMLRLCSLLWISGCSTRKSVEAFLLWMARGKEYKRAAVFFPSYRSWGVLLLFRCGLVGRGKGCDFTMGYGPGVGRAGSGRVFVAGMEGAWKWE